MIHELRTHIPASGAIHEFLDVIQFDMLIIEPTERVDSIGLWEALQSIAAGCERDKDYCITPTPGPLQSKSPNRSGKDDWSVPMDEVSRMDMAPSTDRVESAADFSPELLALPLDEDDSEFTKAILASNAALDIDGTNYYGLTYGLDSPTGAYRGPRDR
jgi:hypothetical protein